MMMHIVAFPSIKLTFRVGYGIHLNNVCVPNISGKNANCLRLFVEVVATSIHIGRPNGQKEIIKMFNLKI